MEHLILGGYMESIRKPNLQEVKLLEFLIKKSTIPIPVNWNESLLVCNMNDGGMGGLRLYPKGDTLSPKLFGKQVSEYQFTDLDGIEVFASLYLDKDGELFELDIWKTNFEKLVKFPNV